MDEVLRLLQEAVKDIETINVSNPVNVVFRRWAIDKVKEAIAQLQSEWAEDQCDCDELSF